MFKAILSCFGLQVCSKPAQALALCPGWKLTELGVVGFLVAGSPYRFTDGRPTVTGRTWIVSGRRQPATLVTSVCANDCQRIRDLVVLN